MSSNTLTAVGNAIGNRLLQLREINCPTGSKLTILSGAGSVNFAGCDTGIKNSKLLAPTIGVQLSASKALSFGKRRKNNRKRNSTKRNLGSEEKYLRSFF